MEAFEIDEQGVPNLIIGEAFLHAQPKQNLFQTHRWRIENAQVHWSADPTIGSKVHLCKDVTPDVYARRNLDQLHAAFPALEYTALGDVKHGLADLGGIHPPKKSHARPSPMNLRARPSRTMRNAPFSTAMDTPPS